ncbi:MAG: flavoprotein [Bacteroidetes bacterium RIFCSPLOWO2_12_FULL_35_15]|nr:MAG: flavoprotein [Bacteroidetes bacterium RIFCSPLOWO2_12_FULL_35_15]
MCTFASSKLKALDAKQIIIIGGGAAGFFAAINCAENYPDYKVLLVEKGSKVLTKVRISGGGRCNLTNACFDNNILVKNYPRGEKELRNVFSRFSTNDTINWFEKRGVKLKTEDDGRMFPSSDNSETIVNCLLQEAKKAGVQIKLNIEIEEILKNENKTFTLKLKDSGTFSCDKLIIATGGSSNEHAYNWLKKLGHTIIKPVPSLFTFNVPNNTITALMGVSVPFAKIRIAGTKLETVGPLMITHWGLSGPAILKASAWGARQLSDLGYNFIVIVNWLPKYTEEKLRIEFANIRTENGAKLMINHCPVELPKRLWEYFLIKANISETLRWGDLPKKSANILINTLLNDEYKVQGKTTFKEEFVTCGGISLKEINLSTMQSKIIPNIYFAGEVLDIDGITGGFNFQNAWSTGWIAALCQ